MPHPSQDEDVRIVAESVAGSLTSLADEARGRLDQVADQQKSFGADQISGMSRAVKTAAGSLGGTSPQLARLVQGAAETLENVAGDIRSKSMTDIIDKLSAFGRRQPLAFFGAAAVAGFVLTRFLKSDAPASSVGRPPNAPGQA